MKITFYGGAGSVTGAMYLLEDKDTKILVECGYIQGGNVEERMNEEDFPFNPEEIDSVIITHSHLDHTGRLPKLFKDGFKGKVYSTAPAKDEAHYLFVDAHNLMMHEGSSIYDVSDINKTMSNWETVPYRKPFKIKNIEIE